MQDLYEVGFQSPYGVLGNTTNQLRSVEDGNPAFQSPYGELGNTTLSLSTRSRSGLTGDFFKPRAFFPFFGDPGSKAKSDSVVFSLSYAIFSPF